MRRWHRPPLRPTKLLQLTSRRIMARLTEHRPRRSPAAATTTFKSVLSVTHHVQNASFVNCKVLVSRRSSRRQPFVESFITAFAFQPSTSVTRRSFGPGSVASATTKPAPFAVKAQEPKNKRPKERVFSRLSTSNSNAASPDAAFFVGNPLFWFAKPPRESLLSDATSELQTLCPHRPSCVSIRTV